MSELALKTKIVKMIKTEYPEVFFWKVADQFTSGIPDIVGCYEGIFFGMELKTPQGKTTRLQDYTIGKIRTARGYAGVVRSLDEGRNFLKAVRDYARLIVDGE